MIASDGEDRGETAALEILGRGNPKLGALRETR